jgi:penicillin amidase
MKKGKSLFLLAISAFALSLLLFFFIPRMFGVGKYPLPKSLRNGVDKNASIKMDKYGIPHIYAQNRKDLFYAYGHFLASERLFQMELQRRLAKGELSELFGEPFIEVDKLFRTLRAKHYLKRNWEAANEKGKIPDDLNEIINSFLRGVNDYILRDQLPLEFYLLKIKPELFTIDDIFSFIGNMSYNFATSFKATLLYDDISKKISAVKFSDMRQRPKDLNLSFPYPKMGRIEADPSHLVFTDNQYDNIFHTLRQLFAYFPPFKGSNSWVISGSKTKSGKPILANDPHIAYSLPGIWFEAHLKSSQR